MGLITIPFRSGMDESVDPRQAPPGTITLLKNAVFTKALEVRVDALIDRTAGVAG